jgi:Trk-type K+ transport system membrane component
MGLTPTLTSISKAFLMLAMYFGRLGPLAFIFIFTRPGRQATLRRLPSERVIAG